MNNVLANTRFTVQGFFDLVMYKCMNAGVKPFSSNAQTVILLPEFELSYVLLKQNFHIQPYKHFALSFQSLKSFNKQVWHGLRVKTIRLINTRYFSHVLEHRVFIVFALVSNAT